MRPQNLVFKDGIADSGDPKIMTKSGFVRGKLGVQKQVILGVKRGLLVEA